MSSSSGKNRNRREYRRIGRKRVRQATKEVLEGGASHTEYFHGEHWVGGIEQPPLLDVPVGPPRKKGCKRNGYGPHVIVPAKRIVRRRWSPYYERWIHYSRGPEWECEKCGKGFWRQPRADTKTANVIIKAPEITTRRIDYLMDDHYDTYNIKLRLLGLSCRCTRCNPENNDA